MTQLFSATVQGIPRVGEMWGDFFRFFDENNKSNWVKSCGVQNLTPLLTHTSKDVVIKGVSVEDFTVLLTEALDVLSKYKSFMPMGAVITAKHILAQLSKPLEEFDLAIASAERDFAQLSPDTASDWHKEIVAAYKESAKVEKKGAFGKGQTKPNALKRRLRSEICALRAEIERLQSPLIPVSEDNLNKDSDTPAKVEITPMWTCAKCMTKHRIGEQHGCSAKVEITLTGITPEKFTQDMEVLLSRTPYDDFIRRSFVRDVLKQVKLPLPEPTEFGAVVEAGCVELEPIEVYKWIRTYDPDDEEYIWHSDNGYRYAWNQLTHPRLINPRKVGG